MTVSELKAILDTLPDDMPVRVNHEPHGDHDPELFMAPGFQVAAGLGKRVVSSTLIIVPSNKIALARVAKLAHWHHINKQEAGK